MQSQAETNEFPKDLVCPLCMGDLKVGSGNVACSGCGAEYDLVEGEAPVFIRPEDRAGWDKFIEELENEFRDEDPVSVWQTNSVLRGIRSGTKKVWDVVDPVLRKGLTPLLYKAYLAYLRKLNAPYKDIKLNAEIRRITSFCESDYYFWEPFAFYNRVMESYYFGAKEIRQPSMEIGGGWGKFTNEIYRDRARITYSSEYLLGCIMRGRPEPHLHPKRHEVFDHLFVSFAHQLPMQDELLKTVNMVHILDHIIELDKTLSEIGRVMQQGAMLHATTHNSQMYQHLLDFQLLRKAGLLSEKYKHWRMHRHNYREGSPFVRGGSYPAGQNRMTRQQWHVRAEANGLKLEEFIPYNFNTPYQMMIDLVYQGFRCPESMRQEILDELKILSQYEVENPPSDEEGSNVFMTFSKK